MTDGIKNKTILHTFEHESYTINILQIEYTAGAIATEYEVIDDGHTIHTSNSEHGTVFDAIGCAHSWLNAHIAGHTPTSDPDTGTIVTDTHPLYLAPKNLQSMNTCPLCGSQGYLVFENQYIQLNGHVLTIENSYYCDNTQCGDFYFQTITVMLGQVISNTVRLED